MNVFQDSLASDTSSAPAIVQQVADTLGIELEILLQRLLAALAILVLAWLGLLLARRLAVSVERRVAQEQGADLDAEDQRRRTVIQLLYDVARVVIVTGALLLVLNLFVPIAPLLAGVGVLGLAVSFGAQSLVRDFISGFFILVENQFQVGDVIEVDGTSGAVERMTLRVVMIRDVEGVLHVIPNGAINKVGNKTRAWSRCVLDVGVAYKEDVDRVITVLRHVALDFWNDRSWRERLVAEPVVLGVQGLDDSAVTVRLVADTKPGRQWEVKRELRRRIKNRFDAEEIEIPFPQRTVHHRPPLEVRAP